MTIGIIGLGYVGLTLAVAASAHDVDVYGVEVNQHIKDCLKKNKAHFFEPGRSNICKPGFVAGPCLEKDAYILINNMPDCDSKKFILSARKFNESLEDLVVSWVQKKVGTPSDDKIVALSGMAFKGQPETSDLRGSSLIDVLKQKSGVLSKKHLPLIKDAILQYRDKLKEAINTGKCSDVSIGTFTHLSNSIYFLLSNQTAN